MIQKRNKLLFKSTSEGQLPGDNFRGTTSGGRLRDLHRGSNDKYFALANSAWRSLSRLWVNVLIASLAGADFYAIFVIFMAIEVIWITLMNAWLLTPMVTISPGLDFDKQCLLVNWTLRRLWRGAIAGGLVLALGWPIAQWFDVSAWVYGGFILATVLQSLVYGLRSWRSLTFRSWHSFWSDFIGLSVPIAGVYWTATYWGGDYVLAGFYGFSVMGQLLSLGLITGKSWRVLRFVSLPDPAMQKRCRRLGIAMSVGSIAYSVGSRLQPMVLAAAAVAIEVSRFGAALALIGPLRMISMALGTILRPRYALYYQQKNMHMVYRLTAMATGLLISVAVLLLLLFGLAGHLLGPMVFGDWFSDVTMLLMVGTVYALLECFGNVFVTAVQTQSDQGAVNVTRLRIGASVLSFVAMWPTCALWGAMGAFVAMAGVEAVFTIICGVMWWHQSQPSTEP